MIHTCKFQQVDAKHVKCPDCGKHLTGTPERYKDKVICAAHGVGTIVARKLQTLADTFHMKFEECSSCLSLKQQMNLNGPDWVEKKAADLIDSIVINAKKQNITIPKFMLGQVLSSAIKEERAQVDN